MAVVINNSDSETASVEDNDMHQGSGVVLINISYASTRHKFEVKHFRDALEILNKMKCTRNRAYKTFMLYIREISLRKGRGVFFFAAMYFFGRFFKLGQR